MYFDIIGIPSNKKGIPDENAPLALDAGRLQRQIDLLRPMQAMLRRHMYAEVLSEWRYVRHQAVSV